MTENKMGVASHYDLDNHGLRNLNMAYWTLTTPALIERIVTRREGVPGSRRRVGSTHR